MLKSEIIESLNNQQKKAVELIDGPLLILAGAGSGKTKVLTHRIANLLESGVSPWSILAITFTNKAADEMKQRVTNLVGQKGEDIWISTFHSMCVRILRKDIHNIGYSNQFTILDSYDQLNLIKQIIKDLNIDAKKIEPRAILGSISNAKNELKTPKDYGKTVGDYYQSRVLEVYERYQARLAASNSLDFDDLIMLTVQLFQKEAKVLEYYQRKFKYVHVDEYQDTNRAQYLLVRMLADYYKNICVVGDTDQSIYKWRGADISNILNFEEDFPDAQIIKLEQNYRSTKTILQAANEVIKYNNKRKEKNLWTENSQGSKITLYRADQEHDEAYFVTKVIQEGIEKGQKYNDYAVLYRTNAQSRVIEEVFIKSNIPYQIVGGIKFYERKEIKDILAYLKLIVNPDDDTSLRRIINVPKRGIGAATLTKISDYANDKGISLFKAIAEIDSIEITSNTANKIISFIELILRLQKQAEYLTVTLITERVIEDTGYIKDLKKENSIEAESRIENIGELLSVAKEFDQQSKEQNLNDFLTELALVSDIDQIEDENNNGQAVIMMTLHSAKGLEFPVVFLTGLEEGIFPHNRSLMEEDDMEEERRLAYVGITRAEQELFITYALNRMLYGRTHYGMPSRFIKEIPDDVILDYWEAQKVKFSSTARNSTAAKVRPKPDQNWEAGDKVWHAKWGVGTVVSTKNEGEDLELQIAFPKPTGVKRLLARFAPIKKVD